MRKVRLLFLSLVDTGNVNAQSLNTREIVLRLDPERFAITLWYELEADSRLLNRPNIRLERLPPHRRTLRILKEMIAGYDIIAYMDYSPASYVLLRLPRFLRRGAKTVLHAEAPAAQLVNPSKTLRRQFQAVMERCDFYTAITEFVASDLSEKFAKKASHILPVGVDSRTFTPPVTRANPVPVVLFAGTVIERKGPQLMLDAAARFPDAVFRVVGAAREGFDAILRQRIEQSGPKNIALDGLKTQSQLLNIMRQSDIFLLPSRLEGMPKVTLEAAATGLPCIVFRDYATPSVINGVTGFQVGTVEEMMQALSALIGDQSLRGRLGAAGRKHVENFDWDIVSKQWQNAYLEIAAGGAR